jgi:ATP-dependent DNA ligase
MKPLLAHTYEDKRINWQQDVWLQYKLNGVRALSQDGFFQSRDELPWPGMMLEHLGKYMKEMFPSDWVLDGELYVHGWPLQKINGAIAVNRKNFNPDALQVEYHIFDRVSFQSSFEDRFWQPMRDRAGLFGPDVPIKLVESIRVNDFSMADDYYALAVTKGYEGIMYRLGNCPYTHPKQPGHNGRSKFLSDKNNRTWHLLKRKDWHDDEFTCVRVAEGEGKRAGMTGALICETKDGHYFGVGSGLTEAECIHYYENPPIGRQIKVKFLTYTSDGVPFNPIVLAVL